MSFLLSFFLSSSCFLVFFLLPDLYSSFFFSPQVKSLIGMMLMKTVGENQINEIISSADAWNISEDLEEESLGGLKATVSSRQIKALIEQITGMSCLPHRQIPTSKGFSKHSSGCFSSDLAKPPRIKDLNRTQLTTRPIFTASPNHPQTPFPNNHPTPPLINLPRPNHILP